MKDTKLIYIGNISELKLPLDVETDLKDELRHSINSIKGLNTIINLNILAIKGFKIKPDDHQIVAFPS